MWDEGAKLYQEMMEGERWAYENDVLISAINPITSKVRRFDDTFFHSIWLMQNRRSVCVNYHRPLWVWGTVVLAHDRPRIWNVIE